MAMPQARHFDDGFRSRTSLASDVDARSDQESKSEDCAESTLRSVCDERALERFMSALMRGDRVAARNAAFDPISTGATASFVLEHLIWPAVSALDGWSRRDQISAVHQHCATLLLAQIARSLEDRLSARPSRGCMMLITSGQKPLEELAGLIFAGLAEADGYEVLFLGGGVESDDAFAEIGARTPDLVVCFAAAGGDAARLRRLLTALREQKPVPGLRVAVGGGVFGRAPGLAEELGINLEGTSPFDLLRAIRAASPSGRRDSAPAAPQRRRSAKAA
jgi:methanogenic corrinoid protein MtbC1